MAQSFGRDAFAGKHSADFAGAAGRRQLLDRRQCPAFHGLFFDVIVVIGETCRIGSHVKLYHGVTLGARSFQRDEEGKIKKGGKRHPDVGDWVTVYPNATILGGETTIGSGSTIGANVFLMESVPPDSLVRNERSFTNIVSKKNRKQSISHVQVDLEPLLNYEI